MMSAHRMVIRFFRRKGYWHGTSIVQGAVYSVRGRNPNHVFNELRDLLHVPADHWRVSTAAADTFVCEALPHDSPTTQHSSTADMPCVDNV